MRITQRHLAAVYDMLRVLPPFAGMRMPTGRKIRIRVVPQPRLRSIAPSALAVSGRYGDQMVLYVASRDREGRETNLSQLIEIVAHEMCHIAQVMAGKPADHGPLFKKLAAQVCQANGWKYDRYW